MIQYDTRIQFVGIKASSITLTERLAIAGLETVECGQHSHKVWDVWSKKQIFSFFQAPLVLNSQIGTVTPFHCRDGI